MSHLNIAEWNANGLAHSKKHIPFTSLLRRHNILCITETHCCPKKQKKMQRSLIPYAHSHTILWSHGSSSSRGVLVVIKKSPLLQIISHKSDTKGRWVLVKIFLPHLKQELDLLTIYSPANSDSDRVKFFTDLELTPNTIIVGDFNVVLDPLADRLFAAKLSSSASRNKLVSLMQSFNLIDIWRHLHPQTIDFTYL